MSLALRFATSFALLVSLGCSGDPVSPEEYCEHVRATCGTIGLGAISDAQCLASTESRQRNAYEDGCADEFDDYIRCQYDTLEVSEDATNCNSPDLACTDLAVTLSNCQGS